MGEITVTVSDDYLGRIDEVASALRNNGMHVRDVLESVGVIAGYLPEDRRAALEVVDGVESVSDSVPVQLPPPESDIQ
jgi:hypothetical protein